ncbi:hypothetical protein PPACK8108_LOCUS1450 [Phakopsora pachyrhizi]|uniref:Uncharacterized protein n=1 Tax=Phakopsora pachyrhizi TaxID=170000 RepID=A0AAV0AFI9_PHAPC|nr:hypothetical protein PPACK8108_LOCUS562 [Phakopsora pachyrhizi]CAH7667072.1 hypothetical protein PPACK8108_LOCUS1450 [Phakopsora pachyrhizi]
MKLTTPGEQHAATVYLIAKIAQKVDCLIEANSVCHNLANMDSQSNTSFTFFRGNNFVWTKPPKDFICIMLHQLLISKDVESYTKGTDSESQILKNILVQDGNPEQQIAKLIELVKPLLEWAAPKGTSYSNKEIKERFRDKKIQHRFALLRVCAAYQSFCNHEALWPKIDNELERLKKKSTNYRNV